MLYSLACKSPNSSTGEILPQLLADDNPLRFQAQGCGTYCLFPAGKPINFTLETNAPPDLYRYDCDGNGTIDQTSTTPRLIVYRATATDELVHPTFIVID